jgi:hypothetical protein
MSLFLRLAATVLAVAVISGPALAAPGTFNLAQNRDAVGEHSVEPAASKFCYPRIVRTYVPGRGVVLIPLGKICLFYIEPLIRRPIGPDPPPFQRFERINPRLY